MAHDTQPFEELLEEASEELLEELQKLETIKKEKLDDLAGALQVKVQDIISKRAAIEARWLEDIRQFHGYYGYVSEKEEPFIDRLVERRRPRINITRPKCLIAEGQMADLQFPGRDRNFSVNITSVPELERGASSQEVAGYDEASGDEITKGQLAQEELSALRLAANRMEDTIWDQLEDCRWGPESREAMRDYVILGTAVMKFSGSQGRVRRKWKKDINSDGAVIHTFDYQYDKKPAGKRVDPWYFFPDMQARHSWEAEHSFELHPMGKKGLSQLAEHPYFDTEALATLLEEEPEDIITSSLNTRHSITGSDLYFKNKYQVFEYHGPIDDDVIEALGLEDGDRRNPLRGYIGEVWFCQGHTIKAELSHIEGDDGIPYMYSQWEPDETNPFGFGIPFLVRDAQRVVNSTWRMILDNSGLAAGPQVVINREMVEPMNGKWDIEPMKVWYVTEYGTKPDEAMFFFSVPSASSELSAVLEMAMKFADSESSMPLISQGEQATYASSTATGIAMQVNEQNVVQKRANKNWDDDITTLMIDRMYMWNMLYNPDDSIKGDYDVVARGSTDLLVKQMETNDAATLLQATEKSPAFQQIIDVPKLARLVVQSMHIPADEVVKSDERIAAEQEQAEQEGPSPEELEAERKQQELVLKQQKQKSDFEIDVAKLELQALKIKNEYEQYVSQAQARVIAEQSEREQAIMKLAADSDMSAKELLAKIGMSEKSEETKRFIASTDFIMKQKELEAKLANLRKGFDTYG